MESKESKSKKIGGLGIVGVVQIVFLILKLCNVIDWSWFWVLSPFWIWAGFLAFLFMLIGVCEYMKDKV